MDPLVVLGGRTFLVSDENGDIDAAADSPAGLMHKDTRHLSRRDLLVNGMPTRHLSSKVWRPGWARIVSLSHDSDDLEPELAIIVDRMVVSDGVHEDIKIKNNSEFPIECDVELRFDTDFADLFEVRGMDRIERAISKSTVNGGVEFSYSNNGFARSTRVLLSAEEWHSTDSHSRCRVAIEPRQEWRSCVHISCDPAETGSAEEMCPFAPDHDNASPVRYVKLIQAAPTLTTDHEGLSHAYRQAIRDLAALHFPAVEDEPWLIPAAGLPWFMAVFGRDSLIAAYQSLPFMPELSRSTLLALSALQSDSFDEFSDAEPGKILHEMRLGELASTGLVPFGPSYGSHDSTLLYLILLDEYHRWTGDDALVNQLEKSARKALEWMETCGDPDGDGLLEYERHSTGGLINQGWKDSFDSMRFADGRIAEGPIATVEIQGYSYDARLRMARLAEDVWGDRELAGRLRQDADLLRARVDDAYWHPDGFYVLALDGEKRQVDSVASNMGHLLWSGLPSQERAGLVVRRLMENDMFAGWGLRTLSSKNSAFNPLSYHNGSVWPHDNSLIAEGMRRYGFVDEARYLVMGLIDAAQFFGYQLPELFAGYSKAEMGFPVQYPGANRPQAWASGSVLLGLRTLLGIDIDGETITTSPNVGSIAQQIEISGLYGPGNNRSDVGSRAEADA